MSSADEARLYTAEADEVEVLARHTAIYNALAPQYEGKVSVHYSNTDAQVERFASFLPSHASVLEVGCAVGTAAAALARRGFRVTGIDLSAEMVERATARVPDAAFICGDFLRCQLASQFDGLYAQSVVHLFPPNGLDAFFSSIRRVVKPHGIALISTTVSTRRAAGWEMKTDYEGAPKRYRQRWTREQFRVLLREKGLTLIDEWDLEDPFGKLWMIFIGRI